MPLSTIKKAVGPPLKGYLLMVTRKISNDSGVWKWVSNKPSAQTTSKKKPSKL